MTKDEALLKAQNSANECNDTCYVLQRGNDYAASYFPSHNFGYKVIEFVNPNAKVATNG